LYRCPRRDEALSAIQSALRDQQQQELSFESEMIGYRKDILKQQVQNEQLTSILRKLEGESQFVDKQIQV